MGEKGEERGREEREEKGEIEGKGGRKKRRWGLGKSEGVGG